MAIYTKGCTGQPNFGLVLNPKKYFRRFRVSSNLISVCVGLLVRTHTHETENYYDDGSNFIVRTEVFYRSITQLELGLMQ